MGYFLAFFWKEWSSWWGDFCGGKNLFNRGGDWEEWFKQMINQEKFIHKIKQNLLSGFWVSLGHSPRLLVFDVFIN